MTTNEHTEQSERAELIRELEIIARTQWIGFFPGSVSEHSKNIVMRAAALLAAYKAGGEVVRYCYECGTIGEVGEGKRDCCPDGSHAGYVHPVIAKQAQAGFYPSLYTRHQHSQQRESR